MRELTLRALLRAPLVAVDKRIRRRSLYRSGSTCNDRRSGLFGSGYTGLGDISGFAPVFPAGKFLLIHV